LGYFTEKIFKKDSGRSVDTCDGEKIPHVAINVMLICITYLCQLQFINFANKTG